MVSSQFHYTKRNRFMPFLLAEILNFQGSTHHIGVGSFSYILFIVKERKNDMHIILNHSSMVPIYEQLMEQIKSEIINTALKEGEALPSVRSLAGELRISALTVKKAYDKLEEEGFVTTIHGKGTYVTASDKQLALEARQREAEADFEKAIDRALAMGMSREDILETVTLLLEEK